MADSYAMIRYEGLSVAEWSDVYDRQQSTAQAGASIVLFEGQSSAGWCQINAGGPNAFGYATALKNVIKAQVGVDPVVFETVSRGDARVRTGDDIREFGHA